MKFIWVNSETFPYQVLSFENPLEVLVLEDHLYTEKFFKKLQSFIKKGFYACGFLSYELGYLLEKKLNHLFKKPNLPVGWFAIYPPPQIFSVNPSCLRTTNFNLETFICDVSKTTYQKNIQKIKEYIVSGDVYQVNYTFKLKFTLRGHPLELFYQLLFSQRCKYGFFLEGKDFWIASLSPELFLKKEGPFLTTSPMKGTIKRAPLFILDQETKRKLWFDEKNRAENVMIVDLLRNDLGRVCFPGEVWVEELFKIETYPTLHQMISSIKGRLFTEDLFEVFKALFPCGSVTGAPKIRAMEIIAELEKEPRGVYTGAIGYIDPKGNFLFNVGIRTLVFFKQGLDLYQGEAGIGSGIVWDSQPEKEYEECLLKAKFFLNPVPYFQLIETFWFKLNTPNPLLKFHYQRLIFSAKFFRFKLPESLKNFASFKSLIQEKIPDPKKYKVRFLLYPEGKIELSFLPFEGWKKELKIAFMKRNFDLSYFSYHKTTIRSPLDEALKKAKELGFDEVVFYDENGRILEGSFSTFFAKKDGKLFTPALNLKILDGVIRKYLIKKNIAIEQELFLEDLKRFSEIYIGNAVRGLGKVKDWFILK
ncbi:aminodeoxychorismate synthase component I [Thermodesulfobacterium sp. TA1]|uniref:aminodeoxychorismate synthase component I n=1 Tax=Thermodesulfobacterium sp. TA1 TaxID=2234087 RepID=UPI001231C9A4|nr:aminodeoxychorismate synthase component I [Thermodesulfobacterium sp. TA1]QER41897.1 aminodeoxychorismate synthase component I [Thermodesulfobacterium sp. TA1]